jgi:hypothetical protein
VEPTGTNRSNPLDPQSSTNPILAKGYLGQAQSWPNNLGQNGKPPACSGKRHTATGPDDDTSPGTFTNSPRAQIPHGHKSPPRGQILYTNPPGDKSSTNPPGDANLQGARSTGGRDSLVATARGQTPDPIPNSAVKTLSADGTASQDAEEQVAARLSQPPHPALPRPSPVNPTQRRGSPG